MADSREVVSLLYRADWTMWSVSAEVVTRYSRAAARRLDEHVTADMLRSSGGVVPPVPVRWRLGLGWAGIGSAAGPDWVETRYRILLGSGGRYRFQSADPASDDEAVTMIVCDGQSCWVVRGPEAERYDADPARTPIDDIVHPGRLLSRIQVASVSVTEAAGRPAYRVVAVPRPAPDWPLSGIALAGQVELLVDAGLGLVLRTESSYREQPVVQELRDVTIDPAEAGEPASFRPPPGIHIDDGAGALPDSYAGLDSGGLPDDGYEVGAGAIAVSAGAAAVHLAALWLARPEPPRRVSGDDEAAMPAPRGEAGPDQGGPASDQLLNLLARTGLPPLNLTAEVHRWADLEAVKQAERALTGHMDRSRLPMVLGFFGGESLLSRLRAGHRTAVLRIAAPGRYRIDYQIDNRPRHPLSVACDAGRLRKAYHNRVVASPAQPMPAEFARLTDPAWLLNRWQLIAAGQATADGRRAYRVIATPSPARPRHPEPPGEPAPPGARVDVLIDADLGIILRQVSYADDRPTVWFEIRNLTCHHDIDPADFIIKAPDLPVIESDGAPIHDLDLPAPVKAAGQAGADLLAGTRSALSWLSRQARKITEPGSQ